MGGCLSCWCPGPVPGNEYQRLWDEAPQQTRCQRFCQWCLQFIKWFLWFICIIPVKEVTIQVRTSGNTGGWEQPFLRKVSESLFWQVASLKVERFVEVSRYGAGLLLVFCPIASRIVSDLQSALEGLPNEQRFLLLPMHLIPRYSTGDSLDTRQYPALHPAPLRTVHTRYTLQDGLYPCEMNEAAVAEVAAAIKDFMKQQREEPCLQRCCCC